MGLAYGTMMIVSVASGAAPHSHALGNAAHKPSQSPSCMADILPGGWQSGMNNA